MTEHQSSRTLVKSAPELWAECSDAASLARHLGAFGEIRITKLEPESTVAWEGAAASGTVRFEPSGWGTRVTLTLTEREADTETAAPEPETVEPVAVEPEPAPEMIEQPEPTAVVSQVAPRPGMFARLRLVFRRRSQATPPEPEGIIEPEPLAAVAEPLAAVAERLEPVAELEPVTEAPPAPEPGPTGEAALVAALESLGMAHHRPYSRA